MKQYILDGCNSDLVYGATFDGLLEIPKIYKPFKFIVPNQITPFSKRKYSKVLNEAIAFYENDENFKDLIISPNKYIEELKNIL